jgi:hypothetical protein
MDKKVVLRFQQKVNKQQQKQSNFVHNSKKSTPKQQQKQQPVRVVQPTKEKKHKKKDSNVTAPDTLVQEVDVKNLEQEHTCCICTQEYTNTSMIKECGHLFWYLTI